MTDVREEMRNTLKNSKEEEIICFGQQICKVLCKRCHWRCAVTEGWDFSGQRCNSVDGEHRVSKGTDHENMVCALEKRKAEHSVEAERQ